VACRRAAGRLRSDGRLEIEVGTAAAQQVQDVLAQGGLFALGWPWPLYDFPLAADYSE
jgi:hypothetical protein